MRSLTKNQRSAFSLAEIMVAIGIIATIVLALIGLIAPAVETTRKVSDIDEVIKLGSTLEAQLQLEDFADFYGAFIGGGNELYYFIYHYRGHTGRQPNADGSLEPQTNPTSENFQLTSVARREGSSEISGDLEALEASMFRAELSLSTGNAVDTLPPSAEAYEEAALALECRIYKVQRPTPEHYKVRSSNNSNAIGPPLYTFNLVVLR